SLLDKERQPRADKLLSIYVRSLALSATGAQALGCVVARDTVLWALPMEQRQAQSALLSLMALWLQGQSAPLPLPLRTAMAAAADDLRAATTAYEGSHVLDGECTDASWARCYASWDDLLASGQFQDLAKTAYTPLLEWKSQYLRIEALPELNQGQA
ncbi:MAG: exodeoxyribonuclease V subunit gamma, partial [Comamonas sp.]